MVRGNRLVILGLFAIPLIGPVVHNVWAVQQLALFAFLILGAIYGISCIHVRHYRSILNAVVVLCALQCLLVILQTLGLDPLFNSLKDASKDVPIGFSGSPNQSGLFFAVTLPVVLAYCPILLPLQLFALFMAKTTSSVIGAVCASLFITRKTLIVIPLLLLLFFFKFESVSKVAYQERFDVWKHSINAVQRGRIQLLHEGQIYEMRCNPLIGFGHGSFKKLSPFNQSFYINPKFNHRYFEAHNDYVQTFFEYGWIGLITLLIAIGVVVRRYILSRKTLMLNVVFSCLIAQAVSALGIFTVRTATSGMLLILFLGMFLGLTSRSFRKV